METIDIFLTNSRYRILWHLMYWSTVLVYYTFYFGHQGGYYWFTFQFVIYMIPVAMGTTYLFNYYLIPKFLFGKKIFYFSLFSIYALIVSFYLISLIIFPFLVISRNDVNMATLDKSLLDIYFLIAGMYTAILLAVLIKLLKYSYERQHLSLKLLEDKTSAELEMLKSQINPHFLFNTLNNIYTLALKKSTQTPEVVLKLSDMLDYLLYDCSAEKVLLTKEITLIENYNYLQSVRFGHRLNIAFTKEGSFSDIRIAPMLLLPFVENSFKHGVGKVRQKSWIRMHLSYDKAQILFSIKNSKGQENRVINNDATGGIGLPNVEKRLSLIYPNRHQLTISDNSKSYDVNLKINTKP